MKKIFLLSVIIPLLFISLLGQNASLPKLSGAEYFVDTDPGQEMALSSARLIRHLMNWLKRLQVL